MENNITISSFLQTELKEYSLYTIEDRAIPSVIDGLKPTQRKIIHTADSVWKNRSAKFQKIYQLAGTVASSCLDYNTEIKLATGGKIKIGEWFDNFMNVKIPVLCVDTQTNDVKISLGHTPKISSYMEYYEIETEDGIIHNLTGNHKVYTSTGYKKVVELNENDDIWSLT